MKILKSALACAAAVAMMGGMSSCQSDDIISSDNVKTEAVKATATIGIGENTRTAFPVDENGFGFQWTAGDKIVIISKDGQRNIGVMELKEGVGSNRGSFEGVLAVSAEDTEVNVYYLGKDLTNGTEDLSQLAFHRDFNVANQGTDIENLTDYGIMHSTAQLKREGSEVSLECEIGSVVSYARFCFHLPEGVNAPANTPVTVKGTNIYNAFRLNFADASISNEVEGPITIVPNWTADGGDAFMMLVPAKDAITVFEVTVGDKTYSATVDEKDYEKDITYCGGQPTHGKDIYFFDGQWTIVYDANEGTGAPEPTVIESFADNCVLTVSEQQPTRNGYVFIGWADSKDAELPQYGYAKGLQNTLTLTRPDCAKILYALWGFQTYTLYYGENGKYSSDSQSYNAQNSTKPWLFNTGNYDNSYPTKEGCEFLGWADTPNATVAQYAKTGADINLTRFVKEKTVYPVFKKVGNVIAPNSKGNNY